MVAESNLYGLCPHYLCLSSLELVLLCLGLAIPLTSVVLYLVYRMNRSPFQRVSSSGKFIDLRLDIENGIDNETMPGCSKSTIVLHIDSPRIQRDKYQLTPIHMAGRASVDNPFRRIATVSPVNSPHPSSFVIAEDE